MLCAHCREGIQGPYLRVGKQAFHPEHFLCRACQLPIAGQYQVHQGMALHPACFAERHAPRCGACGEALTGQYVQFEGKGYHQRCYQAHAAPRCAKCAKPIAGSYVPHGGEKYHPQCFADQHGKTCVVCQRGIGGQYLENYWGHVYHAEHRRELGMCHYCDKPVHPRVTGGGTTYGDGRVICRACHKSAVHRDADVLRTVARVRERLAGWGVALDGVEVPVRVIDRLKLAQLLKGGPHASVKRVSGFAAMTTERLGGRVTKKQATIYLLAGMPLDALEATAAHELMHVWNFFHCPAHTFALEEGSCNYMSYRIHEAHAEPMRGFYLDCLMNDPHPAYGQGFRKVKRYVDRHGFDRLLTLLQRSSDFPLLDGLF